MVQRGLMTAREIKKVTDIRNKVLADVRARGERQLVSNAGFGWKFTMKYKPLRDKAGNLVRSPNTGYWWFTFYHEVMYSYKGDVTKRSLTKKMVEVLCKEGKQAIKDRGY